MLRKIIIPNIFQFSQASQLRQNVRPLFVSATNEAARKGTREKARKKKVKVEIKKVAFIPHNQRKKVDLKMNKHVDDSWKQIAHDDVWIAKYYQYPINTVLDAIKFHRETHHPTMYNVPNAPIIACIEINMQGEKAAKFVENFHRMAPIAHKFDHGEERSILAFTKGQENIEEARKAGATVAGDANLVKSIQNGELHLSDFQYIVAHTNLLPDLIHVRGLMKRKFPSPKLGTLGNDVVEMITRFMNGITYSVTKDEHQKDFASLNVKFGTLDMDEKHLESNLASLLRDIDVMRPKREGKFITRVHLISPPSPEKIRISPFVYVPESRAPSGKATSKAEDDAPQEVDDEDDEEMKEKKEAVN